MIVAADVFLFSIFFFNCKLFACISLWINCLFVCYLRISLLPTYLFFQCWTLVLVIFSCCFGNCLLANGCFLLCY